MIKRRETWKRTTLALALVFSLLLVGVQQAYAQGSILKGSVGSGETVNRDMILYGNDVRIDGTVNGDVVAIGNTIEVNGEVNGSLVMLASQATLNGHVRDSAYAATGILSLGPAASLERALYYAGGLLTMENGSKIGRDLFCLSVGATMSGQVAGTTNAVIGLIPMAQWFIKVTGLQLPGRFNLPLLRSGPTSQLPNAPLAAGISAIALAQTGVDPAAFQNWLVMVLQMLAPLLILGLLVTWLWPAQLYLTSEKARTRVWASAGWGIVALFAGIGLTVLVIALSIMVGYFFYQTSLPQIGWVIWALGLTGIGLGLTLFYITVAYGSKLVVSYLIGRLILERFAPKAAQRFTCTLLGLVIFVLLASLPTLGWVFSVVVSFIGLGAIWLFVRRTRPVEVIDAVEPALEADSLPAAAAVEETAAASQAPAAEELPAAASEAPALEQPPAEAK